MSGESGEQGRPAWGGSRLIVGPEGSAKDTPATSAALQRGS